MPELARLSDPDVALEKIETLYEKVEALFDTIDLIGTLKDRFQTTCDRMSEREAGLLARIERNRELESTFVGALDRVDDLRKRASAETDAFLEAFRSRTREMADALSALRAENTELEEERALLESELSRFGLFMEGTQEAVETLKVELTDFRDGVRKDLSDRFDGEREALAQALSRAREEWTRMGDRFRQTLLERADGIDETTLAKLTESEARLAEAVEGTEKQVQTALASLAERQGDLERSLREAVETRLDEEVDKLAREAADRNARLDGNLATLQEDRAALQALGRDLTDKAGALGADVEARLTKAAADAESAVNAEAKRVAGFVSEAEGKIDGLTGELERLKTDAATGLTEAEKTLERRQTEFEEKIRGEIADRVSGEVDALRETHDGLAASLREGIDAKTGEMTTALAEFGEKCREMDAAGDRLQEAMGDLSAFKERVDEQVETAAAAIEERGKAVEAASQRMVEKAIRDLSERAEKKRAELENAKTAFDKELKARADRIETAVDERGSALAAQVRKVLTAERRKVKEAGEAAAAEAKVQSDELTAFMAGSEEQIARLTRDLDDFRERAETDVRDRITELEKHRKRLEKRIEKTVSSRIGEETARLETSMETSLETAVAQMVEAAAADLAAGSGDAITDIKSYVRKLAQHTQKTRREQGEQAKRVGDQGDVLANLEKRIGRIEALLTRKKKAGAGGGKGGESPPSRSNS